MDMTCLRFFPGSQHSGMVETVFKRKVETFFSGESHILKAFLR